MCTACLTFNSSTFCPHSVFMCFVWIWEQTAIISLYSINWLVFITETECVYCAVRAEYLNIILLISFSVTPIPKSSNDARSSQALLSNWNLPLSVGAADSDVMRCGQLLWLNLDAQRRDDFEIQDEETEFASRLYSCVGRWHGKMPTHIMALCVFQSFLITILFPHVGPSGPVSS